MASITKVNGKWRALVRVAGARQRCMTFTDEQDALLSAIEQSADRCTAADMAHALRKDGAIRSAIREALAANGM